MEDSGTPVPHRTLTSICVGCSQPAGLSPGKQEACGICPGPMGRWLLSQADCGTPVSLREASVEGWGPVWKPPSLTRGRGVRGAVS